jgi:formylglycine-generating enzyme required for sulfatase activity
MQPITARLLPARRLPFTATAIPLIMLFAFFLMGLSGEAAAEKRLALVASVDRYDNLPAARNPAKAAADARAVGAALERLGFDVEFAENLDLGGFNRVWAGFLARVASGDVAAFHFSGHGVELSGASFLVPRDAPNPSPDGEQSLSDASISLDSLLDDLHRRTPRLSLVILNASHDNPFADPRGAAVGASRGLGRLELPKGSFVMSSAGVRQAALDRLSERDADPHSVYVRTLLPLLSAPGLSLSGVARMASARTRALTLKTGRPQTPVHFDETLEDIRLRETDPPGAASESAADESDWPGTAAQLAPPASSSLSPLPSPGESFRDCPRCPQMIVVPAGSFMMGCSPDEAPSSPGQCPPSEIPRHRVTIGRPFAVGRFAVTFAEWDACVADGGCGGYLPARHGWSRSDRPVINVSRDDAKAYLAWLSARTGKTYRLPSEAEREYATRAGSATAFWWGDRITPRLANYNGRAAPYRSGARRRKYRRRTVPVKSFRRNPWGLYQVHGNVWEWVEDCWNPTYAGAPTDGSAWLTGDCSRHALRGGSWSSEARKLRASNRGWTYPGRSIEFGFRVARTL